MILDYAKMFAKHVLEKRSEREHTAGPATLSSKEVVMLNLAKMFANHVLGALDDAQFRGIDASMR